MDDRARAERFEQLVMPHLPAAYNLARWLTRNDQDAEDVTQEACVRAYRFLDGLRGHDGRAWLLRVVRNTCYSWLRQNRSYAETLAIDTVLDLPAGGSDPETIVLERMEAGRIAKCLESLPVEFREVLVLREVEGLSYKEIAEIAGIPVGTVMSRLARGRGKIIREMAEANAPSPLDSQAARKEASHGV